MSLYPIKTRLNLTSTFLTKTTPNQNISARMGLSISEILKPRSKNSQSCIIRRKNSRLRLEFLNWKYTPALFLNSTKTIKISFLYTYKSGL